VGIFLHCTGFPEFSDFEFPAESKQGPLQIGVLTGSDTINERVLMTFKDSLPEHALEALENVFKLRKRLRLTDPEVKGNSRRMEMFDKICENASYQTLATLTEKEALQKMGIDVENEIIMSKNNMNAYVNGILD
jgi:siroheme synthase (precorrin-2 oxidase/ferrochelatase)